MTDLDELRNYFFTTWFVFLFFKLQISKKKKKVYRKPQKPQNSKNNSFESTWPHLNPKSNRGSNQPNLKLRWKYQKHFFSGRRKTFIHFSPQFNHSIPGTCIKKLFFGQFYHVGLWLLSRLSRVVTNPL
jgi:hypothetical protein